ncbi:unnamed protein product [Moneuplotes crassus]|uniref:histidine kinase n=1 Tax=Euplotes crassus TaxID=5936 RepID=A0AAD2DAA4_EUPCR|nr:unnamed protein product [Moneuplotes crassus]
MREIIKMMPFGVVIIPKNPNASQKNFLNDEFKQKYIGKWENLEELSRIQGKYDDSDFNQESSKKNFNRFETDKNVILRINKDNICYKCNHSGDRACDISTAIVNWEGIPSYMHIINDNTELIKAEESKMNQKCQEIMFTNASHDLRTPLNCILNSFSILENSFKTTNKLITPLVCHLSHSQQQLLASNNLEIKNFLKNGTNSSHLLLALVDDILNLSKIKSGKFEVKKEKFQIQDLFTEIYSIFKPQCDQKKLKFDIQICEEMQKFTLISDPTVIRQILINLVSNSLKFTFASIKGVKTKESDLMSSDTMKCLTPDIPLSDPLNLAFKSHITISATFTKRKGKNYVHFSVEDSGVGIPAQKKDKLFKLFHLVTEDGGLSNNVTGLGLTVCKEYTEALGGEIWLESEENLGTIVSFLVPCL